MSEHIRTSPDLPQPRPAAPLRLELPDPAVVLMIGVSGSGKSTTAHALAAQRPDTAVISYDGCREELTGDAGDQTATAAAVALAHHRLDHRCRDQLSTVLDATHVIADHRQAVLTIAARHQVPVVAVVVHSPLATCLARQTERAPGVPGVRWGRRVPAAVIHEQHADLIASLPRLTGEGYAAVHHLPTDSFPLPVAAGNCETVAAEPLPK